MQAWLALRAEAGGEYFVVSCSLCAREFRYVLQSNAREAAARQCGLEHALERMQPCETCHHPTIRLNQLHARSHQHTAAVLAAQGGPRAGGAAAAAGGSGVMTAAVGEQAALRWPAAVVEEAEAEAEAEAEGEGEEEGGSLARRVSAAPMASRAAGQAPASA